MGPQLILQRSLRNRLGEMTDERGEKSALVPLSVSTGAIQIRLEHSRAHIWVEHLSALLDKVRYSHLPVVPQGSLRL